MNELKGRIIILIIVITSALLITILAIISTENDTKDKLAKAGLEECLARPGTLSTQTIWVKSCKNYLQSMEKYNEN